MRAPGSREPSVANGDESGTTRIVVVGNGMVGHRFCERIAELRGERAIELVVIGEENRPAYDRVHLSSFFDGAGSDSLGIADPDWYREQGFELRLGERVESIDRGACEIETSRGRRVGYQALVLATGSVPFVPTVPGIDLPGVFVYRTIDDLEAIREWAAREGVVRAAVIGGGLLGLEAAKAAVDLDLETHVVEFADRLMPRQLDEGGATLLRRAIESLGVHVHTGKSTERAIGDEAIAGLRFADGTHLFAELVIVSAGIRARDDLARSAGLAVSERGGVEVDDGLRTLDPRIYAIGECASYAGCIYGLVAPGYEMADVLARRLVGEPDARFRGADLSTKLKLLGVDVASFGDPFADTDGIAGRRVLVEDRVAGVYQKLVVSADGERLLGGILVGDTSPYAELVRKVRERSSLPPRPHELLTGAAAAPADAATLADSAQVCACNDVSAGRIRSAILEQGVDGVAGIKAATRAGTGCGGCLPLVTRIVEGTLEAAGRAVDRNLCEHFAHTREELFWIVRLGRIRSFDVLLDSHGTGDGCEVCRPAVASILASVWSDPVLDHASIQDTNDRFLANIQRGGTYSVVPRIPGGEITPEKLVVIGEVAARFDLYCKITGGQRIDLLGARVEDLPDIWESLVEAGFESGHAYGKAMRTVKSCVGRTWCRFGVQDSTAFAIRIEERYRGLRAPHKLKSAVSGCIRECAEAQSKDFGLIATEKGWNLYVCGNGGSHPRHADLLAGDLDEETAIRLIDRFLVFYLRTAKPLQRTARWLEDLEGGLDRLRRVVVEDSLGIAARLEADMEELVSGYRCEWTEVVRNPERREWFRHFATSRESDDSLPMLRERGQKRPADWPAAPALAAPRPLPPEPTWSWVPVGRVEDFPEDGGRAVRHGDAELAVFRFSRRGAWYATQSACPHMGDRVLARGLLGSQGGEPKVACPMHKKTFSLATGKGLSDPSLEVATFPVEIRGEYVHVKLPEPEALARALACERGGCSGKDERARET